jgi:hypothetical protein
MAVAGRSPPPRHGEQPARSCKELHDDVRT